MDAPETTRPARHRPRTLIALLVLAVLVIVGLTAALVLTLTLTRDGSDTGTPRSAPASSAGTVVTMQGSVTMPRYDDPDVEYRIANWDGDAIHCAGTGGYDDMTGGTTVTVYGPAGAVVGIGRLKEGSPAGNVCEWEFEVFGLPELPFYQVEVSHRGKVAVQRSQVLSVALNLG